MKSWGNRVNLQYVEAPQEDQLKVGDKIRLSLKQPINPPPLSSTPYLENQIIEETRKQYEADEHFQLLYTTVSITIGGTPIGSAVLEQETHLLVIKNPLTLGMAVAIAILILATVIAIWFGVLAWGTYKFVEVTGGLGGGVGMVLLFILIIAVILGFFGFQWGTGKKKVKVGK